jgi:hypothetical protein
MLGDSISDKVLGGALEYAYAVSMFRADVIAAVLKYHNGNISKSADSLGIGRTTLSEIIKRYTGFKFVIKIEKTKQEKKPSIKSRGRVCDECRCPIIFGHPCSGCLVIESAIESVRASHKA